MSNNNKHISTSPVSKSVPYDDQNVPTNLGGNVQDAIDELYNTVIISASPGFTFSRSGTLPASTWLLADNVPSNVSSRVCFLNSAEIVALFCANQDPSVLKIGIYTHEGDETNLTLLSTVTTAAQRTNTFSLSLSVPYLKQIAIRVESDSPNSGKNLDVGLILKGSL